MRFYKFAARLAINIAAKFNSPMAVSAVAKIIDGYSSRASFESPSASKDFHDVVKHACRVVRAPQDSGSLENFYVGVLKYNLPNELNDEVFKFLVEVARPYGTRINLANFTKSTKDPFLAEKAMDTILKIESKNGLGNHIAIDCLGRVLVLNDSLEIKRKALEKLCAIGSNEAYRQAIDGIHAISFLDKDSKPQEYLIDSIVQSQADDKLSLLLKCQSQGVVVSMPSKRKVFAAFCELSKIPAGADDHAKSHTRQAAEAAAKMFYETQDGEYLNMGDLAQVLLGVSQRNPSPASMKPLFAAVANPEKGLKAFVEAEFSLARLQGKTPLINTPDLRVVFGKIDAENAEKGCETPLKKIYIGLCSAAVRLRATSRDYTTAFELDK